MKIDFNKIEKSPYPKELEEYFSSKYLKKLGVKTDSIRYKYQKDYDLLSLEQFQKLKVNFKNDLAIPEDVKNSNDFYEYLFNSQTTVALSTNKTTVIIDDVEIPIKYFNIDKNGNIDSFKYDLSPSQFDDADYISWKLQTKNNCKEIKLKRTKHNSAYIKKYEYVNFPLKVNLFINKNNDISINIATVLNQHDRHTTVSSILEALDIQIAFYKKELLINNTKISKIAPNKNFGSQKVKTKIQENYNYWSKVKKMEYKLNSSLKIKFPLKSKDIILLDKMIVSLVLDKPFRESYNITNINLSFNKVNEAEDFKESLKKGSKALISWRETEKINLFDMNYSLYKFYYISNFYVESIEIKEDPNVEMTISVREIENKKMIVVSKYILENETEIIINQSMTPKYLIEFQKQLLSK